MHRRQQLALLLALLALAPAARAEWIWAEGEKPARASMHRHPYWYDMVHRDQLSGGDLISNFDKDHVGEASYRFRAKAAGDYEFWVRANPIQARLSYRLNGGEWTPIDLEKNQGESVNVAADDKPDLRFLAWVKVGKVALMAGENAIAFRMDSPNSNHGYLDCFVLSTEPIRPRGTLKPDQAGRDAEAENGWFAFDPRPDPYSPQSGIDLRPLNEKFAGEHGVIRAKDGQFVHSASGEPIRFWAVNGPPGKDREALRAQAKMLAKHGVNLVRIHHGYFDENGEVKPDEVRHAQEIVAAMKAEGIYSHFSIYFPLWLRPKPDTPWLKGYDGKTIPFAALFFNKDFQQHYLGWWRALLTTPGPDGKRLVDDPAVFGLEILNEDSYFFWTFTPQNIPDPQLRILESQFGDWAKAKYGSIDKALAAWGNQKVDRDAPGEGRLGFRPLWNMAHEKSRRDQDAARFLVESQRGFYKKIYDELKALGFEGVITCSNWTTASPEVLGPLEKYSYTVGDFIDRHGYFGCNGKGEASEWSIRDGHTFADRSALRFDPEEPGKPKLFAHPAMDPSYDGKPSMISETTWNRPNRYRSEAPLYYAAFGALQGSDAIVHFALDGGEWSVKPGFFMQPWTLMSPAMMGQFPAAALLFRQGLVAPGETLVSLNLRVDDLLALKGTPLPQDAALDELRLKDLPRSGRAAEASGGVIDPLVHYAGRADVRFTEKGGTSKVADLSKLIDRKGQVVRASNGQLTLDYGKGLLTIDAPAAQGVSGDLKSAGTAELKDLSINSPLDLGHIIAVSLDGKPLATSRRILLQAMTEEKATGFRAEPTGNGGRRITSIGRDPWLVKDVAGTVRFRRPDADKLKVQPLDANGDPARAAGHAREIKLGPKTLYYLITP